MSVKCKHSHISRPSWSCGSWIYSYLCNQYPSPLKMWLRILAKCTLCNFMWSCLSVTCGRSVVFSR